MGNFPRRQLNPGKDANVVRSEVIRFFAYGGNERNPISGSMIHIHGAWVCGSLDLMHAHISYVLHFESCHFADYVTMQHAKCDALYLDESRLARGLFADSLTTTGNVRLRNVFSIEGGVRMLSANIGGDLSCMGGEFHNQDRNVFFADRLKTKGNVNLGGGLFRQGYGAVAEREYRRKFELYRREVSQSRRNGALC